MAAGTRPSGSRRTLSAVSSQVARGGLGTAIAQEPRQGNLPGFTRRGRGPRGPRRHWRDYLPPPLRAAHGCVARLERAACGLGDGLDAPRPPGEARPPTRALSSPAAASPLVAP